MTEASEEQHGVNENFVDNDQENDNQSGYDTEGSEEGSLNIHSTEKVMIEKADRALFHFNSWYKQNKLILNPTWQRKYVWDTRRASKLIESFLLDIPIPVIYLAKNAEGKYEVIDGVQRLNSIFKFFDGDYAITGLDILTDLNGKKFGELSPELQDKLQDTTLRTFELAPQTSQNLLFIIFERLNTGGVKLNEMEIRNSIFRGKLNDLIGQLASNPDFLACVNQKNLDKRMSDRSLVLRFLAFYEKTYLKAKDGMKPFFNDFMKTYRNPEKEKLKEFEQIFKHAMRASLTVFGNNGFRLRKRDGWGSQVNASVFQVIATSFANYDIGQITRRADAIYEEYIDLVTTDNDWVKAVSQATGGYAAISYAFETWQSRLKQIMKEEVPNDKKRVFSRELKRELFEQNNSCKICGQEIKIIQDAAIDHVEHYWRGGQTIPENARLVHRLCNMQRPK
ncbi:DUF262 domain-containing protein [Deinococcus sp. YIM 134068]|uniref:GmrSD restriction endonuclease domain-containing protein n=1 Tax=Deinococcus lichenicola TaxID=3118910 RepID=UPI002F93C4D3